MNKKYDILYDDAKSVLYNKDIATSNFVLNSLNRTIEMFVYTGLPDSIPQKELERLLQTSGRCIITMVDDNLYALDGSCCGVLDAYNRPTQFQVSNVYLNISKLYNINIDCILVKNDYAMQGLLPIFKKYAVLINETEITMNMASILLRIPMLISAPDDKTKTSAELFLKRIVDGEYGIIGETPFFDGIKTHTNTNNYSAYLTGFIELMQYYKGSFYNDIGLNANFNLKRERLNEAEIALNVDALLPLIDNMYNERVAGCELINKKYGTNIICDYNSSWKATHEEEEKEITSQDTKIIDDIIENAFNFSDVDVDESVDAPVDESVDTPVNESVDEYVDESVDAPVDESVDEYVDESVDAPVDESVVESVDEPIDDSILDDMIADLLKRRKGIIK